MVGRGSNNCERSAHTYRLREAFTVHGVYLQAKYALFQPLFGLNLQKYKIWGYKGAAKFWELNMHKFGPFLV